ncbi:HlyD family secretion protein [Vibrio splendidus]|uniref:HlyD family secretion protein n=1 Tax=Vibrio splendidus TaxID=29497 RepID=UPI00037FEEC3|nr:HlyD family efflux transporter periplasmic adaptor subunit [Vibrio splendidus]PTO72076.1 HlyD family secretion protein [Vibrio splendidus]HAS24309.1 HlyD family secretion protein [Vibrio sp.]
MVGIEKRQKVLAMKVKFHLDKKNKPQSDDGVKVAYGQAKRGGYRFRWYLILSLVISPLLFVAYFFFKTNILVIAPAIITSYPVTLTAKVAGVVGPIPIEGGTRVEQSQTVIQLTNLEIEAQIEFIHSELLGLDVNLPSDIEALHLNGLAETRRNLSKVQEIQKRYEEYRRKGQVSDVDYASIVGMGNSLNNQLNQQKLDFQNAKLAEEERALAGPVSQARRALMKDLALKRVIEQGLSIKSPYTGHVVDIHVVEGQRVFEGDELVTIAKNTVPNIVAYLDPKYLEDSVKGANVLIKFPNGSSFEAEVSDSVEVVSKLPSQLVSPFEGQPTYLKVVLDFVKEPPGEYWVEGMTVEARF